MALLQTQRRRLRLQNRAGVLRDHDGDVWRLEGDGDDDRAAASDSETARLAIFSGVVVCFVGVCAEYSGVDYRVSNVGGHDLLRDGIRAAAGLVLQADAAAVHCGANSWRHVPLLRWPLQDHDLRSDSCDCVHPHPICHLRVSCPAY